MKRIAILSAVVALLGACSKSEPRQSVQAPPKNETKAVPPESEPVKKTDAGNQQGDIAQDAVNTENLSSPLIVREKKPADGTAQTSTQAGKAAN